MELRGHQRITDHWGTLFSLNEFRINDLNVELWRKKDQTNNDLYLQYFHAEKKLFQTVWEVVVDLNSSLVNFRWWQEIVNVVRQKLYPMRPTSWFGLNTVVLNNIVVTMTLKLINVLLVLFINDTYSFHCCGRKWIDHKIKLELIGWDVYCWEVHSNFNISETTYCISLYYW